MFLFVLLFYDGAEFSPKAYNPDDTSQWFSHHKGWYWIRTDDGVSGWVNSEQMTSQCFEGLVRLYELQIKTQKLIAQIILDEIGVGELVEWHGLADKVCIEEVVATVAEKLFHLFEAQRVEVNVLCRATVKQAGLENMANLY